jgi:hypothetical protein
VAHALLLADGRSDTRITLLNVQNQQTLYMSDVSSITSVGANTERAVDQSKKALHQAIQLCRNAHVKFDTRSARSVPLAKQSAKLLASLKLIRL